MLTPGRPSPLRPGAEDGISLIEVLVVATTSIIIVGALLAILEFSLKQETRISDRVQADRIGRTAMASVLEELHSSCTGFGSTALQAPSTVPSAPLAKLNRVNLWFLSAYGVKSAGNASLSEVALHDVEWTATKTSNTGEQLGTLTDYSFANTGGSAPSWKFPTLSVANASSKVLAANVIPPEVSGSSTLFQYYKFSGSGSALTGLSSESEIATAVAANEIVKVAINFTQAPEGADTRADRILPYNGAVWLRFNPTETGSEAENEPCT